MLVLDMIAGAFANNDPAILSEALFDISAPVAVLATAHYPPRLALYLYTHHAGIKKAV